MRFGDYIKDVRRQREWTQPEAAQAIGIEQSYLSKLETGKSYPSEDVFSSLMAAYDIQLTDLQEKLFAAELDQLREISQVRKVILQSQSDLKNRVQYWLAAGVGALMIGGACLGTALIAEDEEVTRFLYKAETEIEESERGDIANVEDFSEVSIGLEASSGINEQYKSVEDYRGVVFREEHSGGQMEWRLYGSDKDIVRSPLRWFMVPAMMMLMGALGCFVASYRSR